MACVFKDTILELAHISAYSIEKGWNFGNSYFNDNYDHSNYDRSSRDFLAHSIEKTETSVTPPIMASVVKKNI